MKTAVAHDGQELLSPGEYQFYQLLAAGYKRHQIATRMNCATASLNTFAHRGRCKLRCTTVVQAAIKFKAIYDPRYGYRYSHVHPVFKNTTQRAGSRRGNGHRGGAG